MDRGSTGHSKGRCDIYLIYAIAKQRTEKLVREKIDNLEFSYLDKGSHVYFYETSSNT